jgi:hypothetical protein
LDIGAGKIQQFQRWNIRYRRGGLFCITGVPVFVFDRKSLRKAPLELKGIGKKRNYEGIYETT